MSPALLKSIFPDSTIAKNFSMNRNKVSNIINEIFMPVLTKKVSKLMQENYFTLGSDCSRDVSNNNNICHVIKLFDRNDMKIK